MAITVDIKESFASENDLLAAKLRERFRAQGLFVVNLLGTAGSGKTSLLIRLIEELRAKRTYVIEGDIASNIDTDKLRGLGIDAYQINTGGTCHLNAAMIEGILEKMRIERPGILFVENIGNLICPVEYDLGERLRVVAASVPEGADKPYKYPAVFQTADCVVITKSDLLPFIEYDLDFFTRGVHSLNAKAPIFQVSAKRGEGFGPLTDWVRAAIQAERPDIL